jgi:hypothetical protein
MNIKNINELPLQKERKFKGLFCLIEIPCSLVFVDHHDSRTSPRDEQQMHVSACTPLLLAHTTYLQYLNPNQLTTIVIHLFYSQWMNVYVKNK